MSKKCRAYSESKLGLEPPDNRKAFYAGWDAALRSALAEPVQEPYCYVYEYDGAFGLHREFYSKDYNGHKPDRKVALYTAPPQRHLPDWISYDKTTDVLNIHGKKYAAAIFGEEGFLSPTGTVLRVEQSQPETVTLTVVPQRKPLTDEEIADMWVGILYDSPPSGVHEDGLVPHRLARAIERAHGIK